MQGTTQAAVGKMWEEFTSSKAPELRRKLVLQYMELVHYVVGRFGLQRQGRPHGLEEGDIMQFGVLGLLNAIDRFSPSVGVKFETYAIPRIRGAILDELRELDWVPRSVRANNRRIERATQQVAQENGREAVGVEIAGKLEMSLDEYRKFITGGDGKRVTGLEVMSDGLGNFTDTIPEEGANPLESLSGKESKAILIEAVSHLPPRDRSIIALYYYEGLKFGEIGKILRVSESRVSQIHGKVLRDLRQRVVGLQ